MDNLLTVNNIVIFMIAILATVALIILIKLYKKRQELSELLFTALLAPLLTSMIFYLAITYRFDELNKRNYSLELSESRVSVFNKEENFTVSIPIEQGGILEMYLFSINGIDNITSEKIDINNSDRKVEFTFQIYKKLNIKSEEGVLKKKGSDEPCDLNSDAKEFILYIKDFNANEQYKYMVIKPEISLNGCEYVLKLEKDRKVRIPITYSRAPIATLIDLKFIDKVSILDHLEPIVEMLDIDLTTNINENTLEKNEIIKIMKNERITMFYSLSRSKEIIEILKKVIDRKNY